MHRHCYETIVCLENGKQVICLDIPDSVQTLGPQMIVAHVLGMTSQQLHGLPLEWELKSEHVRSQAGKQAGMLIEQPLCGGHRARHFAFTCSRLSMTCTCIFIFCFKYEETEILENKGTCSDPSGQRAQAPWMSVFLPLHFATFFVRLSNSLYLVKMLF